MWIKNRLALYMAMLLSGSVLFMPACFVYATPANFPDLSHYQPVDPNQYLVRIFVFSTQKMAFVTPNGHQCTIAGDVIVRCNGHFHRQGSSGSTQNPCQLAVLNSVVDMPINIQVRSEDECLPNTDGAQRLNAGFKITYNGTTCAVGEHDLLACINRRQHGFVVTGSGNSVF